MSVENLAHDREARASQMFAESTGKTGLPGSGNFRQGDNRALRGEDGPGLENATRGIKGG
jgi:hypothetical protein